ncbi:MAG: FlgD immunoglobulin-like domain containing protein [Rectinemataceae bacterium]
MTLGANTTLNTTNANITFLSTVDAAVANTQTLSLTAGTGTVAFQGTVGTTALGGLTVTSAGSFILSATKTITVNGAGNAITLNVDGQVSLGGTVANTNAGGNILIEPVSAVTVINLNNGATGLYLTAASLANLAPTGGTVTIGFGTGTGAIGIGSGGTIAALPYSLTIVSLSGNTTFNFPAAGNSLNLGANKNLVFSTGTGTVTRGTDSATNDISLSGTGTLSFTAKSVGIAGTALAVSVPNLGATTLTGALYLSDSASLTVTGAVGTGANALSLATTGATSLTVNFGLTSTAGGVTLTAGSGGFTLAVGITVGAGSGDILVDGGGGPIQFNTGALHTTSATATAVKIVHGTTVTLGNIDNGLGVVVPGTLTLGAGAADVTGAVTQTATILKVQTLTGSTGNTVALTNGNTIPTLGAFTTNNGVAASLQVTTTGALAVNGQVTTGTTLNDVTLTATGVTIAAAAGISAPGANIHFDVTVGGVTQNAGAGILNASGMEVVSVGGAAAYLFPNANTVGTLAAATQGGAFTFNDTATALTVGTVGATTGIATTGQNASLATTTSGSITIAKDIVAGAGYVSLSPATGGASETTGKITTTTGLVLLGAGTSSLTNVANSVVKLAISTSGTTSIYSLGVMSIGTVNATTGASVGANNLTLNGTGAWTQVALANITASGLELLGTGSYTFNNAGNDIAKLAGNVANNVSYTDANAVVIDTVNTVGLTAVNVSLTVSGGGGGLTQNQKLISSGLLTITAGTNAADLETNGTSNSFATVDIVSSGAFSSTSVNGYSLYGTASGNLDATTVAGTLTIPALQTLATTGAATQNLHPAGSLQVNGQVTTVDGQATLNSGTTIFLNYGGGTVVSGTGLGAVQFSAPVVLQANTIITTTNNSNITFSSTINGAQTLDLSAGTGSITVTGIIGTATGSPNRPTGLTVNTSAALGFNNGVWVNGDVTLRSTSVTLSGSFNAEGTGNVYLYGQNGAQTLDVGTGATYLSTASLGNLTTAKTITVGEAGVQSGLVSFATATLAAGLYINVPNLTTVTVNSNSGAGQVTLNDDGSGTAFNLNGAAVLNISAGTGGITATNATNAFAELSTSGTITLSTTGAIGSLTNRIQFPAGQTNVNVTNAPGGVWFDGLGSLTFGAIITNSTAATGLDVTTHAGSNGSITLAGTVNTSGAAAGNGSISLAANGTGTIFLNSAGMTMNAVTVSFSNPVFLQSDASIQTTSAGGSVVFASTVDSAVATSHSLTIGVGATRVGAVTFPLLIGGTTALSALSVYAGTGASTVSLIDIGTAGAAGVTGAVIVDAGALGIITSTMANWHSGGNQSYVASSMTLSSALPVTIATGVGGAIDVSGVAALNATSASTTTFVSDDIVLGALPAASLNFASNTLYFFTATPATAMHIGYAAGPWSLDQTEISRIQNATTIVFGKNGTQVGTISFKQADFSALDGTTGANVEAYSNGAATGAIVLNDANTSFGLKANTKYVALFAGTDTVNGDPGGKITATAPYNGLPEIDTTGNIYLSASNQIGTAILPIQVKYYATCAVYIGYKTDGVTAVNPSAPNGAWVEGIGGLVLALNQLTAPGQFILTVWNSLGHLTLTTDITTGGPVTFGAPIVLAAVGGVPITIDSTPNYSITFNSTIDAAIPIGPIGPQSLIIKSGTGDVAFNAPIGNDTLLTDGTSVTSIVDFTVENATNVSFGNAIPGSPNLKATGNASITNTGTLAIGDSNGIADTAVYDIDIGGSFTQSGATSVQLAGDIRTANNAITFNSPVVLTGNVALNSGSGAINFLTAATIDDDTTPGNANLIILSSGTTNFAKAVGSTRPITSLTTDAGGGTTIAGGSISTTGIQSYGDAVVLGANTTLSSVNSDIIFGASSNLDTTTAGSQNLTINAGTGNVSFAGTVGSIKRLGALSVTGGSGVAAFIKPAAAMTANSMSFTGPVQLQGVLTTLDTSAANGAISFNSTLDALAAGAQGFTITAGTGNVSFVGVAGGNQRLGALSVSAGTGTTAFIKPSANLNANSMTFVGPVQLQNSLTFNTAANNGNISFSTTLDAASAGVQGLTLTAGTGMIAFTGALGSNARLASVTATSANAAANAILANASILTTGAQTYNGSATVAGAAGDIVNSSAGLVTFNGALTHTSGQINAGPGAVGTVVLRFAAAYSAAPAAVLNGNVGTSPDIEFDSTTLLGTYNHNGNRLVFAGNVTQTFDSHAETLGDVKVNMATPASILSLVSSAGQYGAAHTLELAQGILDLNGNGWRAAAVGPPIAGLFYGSLGTLMLDAGTELRCADLSIITGYTVNNAGSNQITASGNVTISGTFIPANSTNSTLAMTGTGMTLTATPQIGNLTVSGSVTLGLALSMAGNMDITGTLDVSPSGNYPITVAGNWTNAGTFNSQTGTVTFTGSNLSVSGPNTWYNFVYQVPGGSIHFQEAMTQSIKAPGIFTIIGASGSNITLTRQIADADLGWNTSGAPNASLMWQLNLNPGATLNMAYVTVKYSDARAHPVAVLNNVSLFYWSLAVPPVGFTYLTCYQWLTGVLAVYSYAEDSDGDGRIDRIRVVAQAPLNGNFSGFTASVTGYTIDTSKGTNGFAMVPSGSALPVGYGGVGYEFFIYLVEKIGTDTGATPSWSIVSNTSLMDISTASLKLVKPATLNGPPIVTMATIDEASPRIAYTLALPGRTQVFFHFSEPVYRDQSGLIPIALGDFPTASGFTPITTSGIGVSEALVTYPTITAAAIAAGTVYSLVTTLYDLPQTVTDFSTGPTWPSFFIANYGGIPPAPYNNANSANHTLPNAWPMPIVSLTHRVSDLMIDLPPPVSGPYDPTTYFAWPIYAKDQVTPSLSDTQIAALTPAQSAAEGIGLIRAFDGSQWLRPQKVTVQARVSASLGALQPSIFYDTNVASTFKGTTGLWLPPHPSFTGLDAAPDTSAGSQNDAILAATGLWNLSVPGSDPKIKGAANGSMFDFFFTLSTAPSDLYVARLDILSGAPVPADWYLHIKPFSFFFHSVVIQKGGATILNNVINPTKGDIARLSYQLPTAGSVTITVFTLDGDVVARLANSSSQAAGDYVVSWNGRNLSGAAVARGLYFVRIVAPGLDEIRKVLVVR